MEENKVCGLCGKDIPEESLYNELTHHGKKTTLCRDCNKAVVYTLNTGINSHKRRPTMTSPNTDKINTRLSTAVFFHLPQDLDGYLSNWYPAAFTLDGITFSSTEQYIMYRKCQIFGDTASASAVLATDDPAQQQAIGKKASGFNATLWDGLKQAIAFRGLMAKFSQNEDLKKQLLDTGDKYLVECENPRAYGKGLTANRSGQWRYRIGDYRLICSIEDERLIILALSVGHRSDIYKQ